MTALNYEQSKRGYQNLFDKASIRPERRAAAQSVARRVTANAQRYAKAGGRVPWYWVGITHNLEAGGNFNAHLHNGDPLIRRTTHVPAGRPLHGREPFTWEESATDALEMHGLNKVEDWSTSRVLYEWERYNGFGYVARGVNSPYLWSFTDQYGRGKYVADGKFDANAVSQQCGAVAALKAMVELKFVTLPNPVLTEAQKKMVDFDRPVPPFKTSPIKEPMKPQWDIIGMIATLLKRIFTNVTRPSQAFE